MLGTLPINNIKVQVQVLGAVILFYFFICVYSFLGNRYFTIYHFVHTVIYQGQLHAPSRRAGSRGYEYTSPTAPASWRWLTRVFPRMCMSRWAGCPSWASTSSSLTPRQVPPAHTHDGRQGTAHRILFINCWNLRY